MVYIEMSRTASHGGEGWEFPKCVWSPSRKENGVRWPFWEKVRSVIAGDTIIHLRGIGPEAFFTGYSLASASGFETRRRPPNPGEWKFAKAFYRADLGDFTPLHKPINLVDLFAFRRKSLEEYFEENKTRGTGKRNIFFVRQAGRLQCLNGAYLSDVDDALLTALFGVDQDHSVVAEAGRPVSVETDWQLTVIKSRIGQAAFSTSIKDLYGNRCCFPSCAVTDKRFLVGSHIARWSDNEELRGQFGNGLCLCVFHDKAFELGLFTIDARYRVFANPREMEVASGTISRLVIHHGHPIRLAKIHPLQEALREHWTRTRIAV